ncbi:peptidoglycan editing factor PgeF [Cohnella sp.]|uniref:peptidoglycan editing factor PgeF n=1 Tax=Cohnella sp. TaxID=1883426 RepID=UPI003565E219
MEPFQLRTVPVDNALLLLQSWCESDGLTAGFTARQAGNTALHVGDEHDTVINNRRRITDQLGWPFGAFTCAEQVHGNHVHVVTREDAGKGREVRQDAIQSTDAMITNETDLMLVMFFADCVPLYFYDPVTKSMGLAHAGWKGTVSEVAIRTVEKLSETYGAKPENIIGAIGPSIGSCCYEVDEFVLQHVRPLLEGTPLGNDFLEGVNIIQQYESNNRAFLDLKHLNRHLMIKAGILPSNIEISSWCTSCRTDIFFSHRKENGVTGRMMSWMGRKSR